MRVLALFAHIFCLPAVNAVTLEQGSLSAAAAGNPIRKVVNLLQAMQKKVAEEGARAEDLHQKFMCYCKNSGGDLAASIEAAESKAPDLEASIKAAVGQKAQLDSDVASHQADREAAKKAMAEATALRKKEKAVFDKALADNKANYAATKKAARAVEEGMGGSFLQTADAVKLRGIVANFQSLVDTDRQEVLSFLSGTEGGEYAPASGEIVGILKTMADEMLRDQKDIIATEEGAVKAYGELMGAKKKEVAALQKSLEVKLARVAEVGVSIATMKNDHEDTAEGLEEDKAFAADMKKNCAEKGKTHEEARKMRAEETVALADTIKVLNDDDALEIFKKTLPGASSSFLQVLEGTAAWRAKARVSIEKARKHLEVGQRHRLDFVLLALRGKKLGFEKVTKLIEELVATLKSEQQNDDDKKEYCEAQADQIDDKKKDLQRSISDHETVIAESQEGVATLGEEIKALKAGIAAVDKAVQEATAQRRAESAEYKDLMASNGAAKELILFAKNRLQKFYNPRLHKAAAKRELSEGDRIYENEGGDIPTDAPGGIAGTGVTALVQLASQRDAPPPPPETAAAYVKKSGESAGVMAMMDLLVKDLDKEMTESKVEERNAKEEYETAVADAAEKRRRDARSLTEKEAARADLQSALEQHQDDKKSAAQELMGTMKYIATLHSECDWLAQYYAVRKTARADEVESLQNAKAVLSGADYSLLQRSASARSRKFLRHA